MKTNGEYRAMDQECRRLTGKTVVLTGGAGGIGVATARRLLAEGASVVVGDIHLADAERLVHGIREHGNSDRFAFCPCDVSQESDVIHLLRYAVGKFGRLDCMINNAATGGAFSPLVDTRANDWDRTQQVNLRGAFLGTKHAARTMIKQGGGGSIVNVASLAALAGGAAGAAYAASKAAVVALTTSAAAQLGRHFIRCNVVIPGAIVSPLVHRNINPEEMVAIGETMQPLPVAGTPEMVAPTFAFLASDDARFVSGQMIVVDGGASVFDGPEIGQPEWVTGLMSGMVPLESVTQDGGLELSVSGDSPPSVLAGLGTTRSPAHSQRRIVITDMSRGLGYALAREFHRRGHPLAGCVLEPGAMARLRDEFGPATWIRELATLDDASVTAWVQQLVTDFGAPDLLINHFAFADDRKPIWEFRSEEVEKMLEVNVLGTVNVLRHLLPVMIRRMSGIIVNFGSAGCRPGDNEAAQWAARWAVEGLNQAMYHELPKKMAAVTFFPGRVSAGPSNCLAGESGLVAPESWARRAADYFLELRPEDNGRQISGDSLFG